MEKPTIREDNRVLVERTIASRELSLGIEDKINQLLILNPKKRIKEFLFFITLYMAGVLSVALSGNTLLFYLLGIVVMGVALNCLGTFLHEGLHGLLANNPKINHLISFLIGLPVMLSATAYYTTHLNHHYELGRKSDYGTYRQYFKNPRFIWFAYFSQLFFGSLLYVLLIPILGLISASNKSRIVIISEYCLIITIFIIFFTYVPASIILTFWLYPIILMNILTNIRGLGSHALGDYESIYLSSRTIESTALVSFLFLYDNYHLEHHLFPRTPSYNLRKMHELIWHRLPQAAYSKNYMQFLFGFFKAAFKNNLEPMGVINPKMHKVLVK